MKKFIEQAKLIKEEIISYRRVIHSNPEVGQELPKTKKYVMDKLVEFGYSPEEICESGIVATIKGNKPGKTFLLRADMDALPMPEESGEEFACPTGKEAHTCGHDFHAAMLLTAAKMLRPRCSDVGPTACTTSRWSLVTT